MHVVEDSKIRGLGEEIRFRSVLANKVVKFSDYESRNLIITIKKEDGRVDTYSSGNLLDLYLRYMENNKKYFSDMLEKNNSSSIVYGISNENNRARFVPLFDITNKRPLSMFYYTPLVCKFKNQDKILVMADDDLAFLVLDYENIPLLAILKHMSSMFLKPATGCS